MPSFSVRFCIRNQATNTRLMAGIPTAAISCQSFGPYVQTDSESESDTDQQDGISSQYPTDGRKHEYRPLKPNEIRLLILNPGLPDDPIECFLEHYSVNQAKPYLALSYVWGDTQDSSFIRVDDCPFKVTDNLRSFLEAYRTNDACPVLWIDAICINQNDISERNAQIRLMKRVYEGADSVVIWLGPDVDGTKTAIQYMKFIYRNLHDPDSDLTAREVREILDTNQELYGEVWPAVQDILERPWWSRIWVYQEATAPTRHDSIVFCGPNQIMFEMILAVNKIFHELALHGFPDFGAQTSLTGALMKEYSELRREYHQKGTSSFLRLADLLPTLRGFAATNPRDKLYALIPTSLDGADLLDVDYGLSVVEVYTNAALSFIHKHRNLDILGHCTGREQDSQLVLPSWVPDWTSNCAPIHFFKRGVGLQPSGHFDIEEQFIGNLYNACLGTVAKTRVDESSTKLFCQGVQYDCVDFASPSINDTFQAGRISPTWKQWLKSLSCEFAEEDFSHTLAADCMMLGVDIACRGFSAVPSPIPGASTPPTEDTEPSSNGSLGAGRGITGIHPATFRRRLIVTKKRHLGLAAEHVQRGDVVVILLGGQLPIILRKVKSHYVLIGEAYVHGIMDGEALSRDEATGSDFDGTCEEFEIW